MNGFQKLIMCMVVVGAVAGCSHSDKPHQQGKERPPLDEINSGGRGLQSKELLQATDQMAMELLSLPELNASKEQWTIVTGIVENQTLDTRNNYNIFIDRLKTSVSKQGRGRLIIIENRDRYRDMQGRELEPGMSDSGGAPGPAGVQPDFILYGKAQEMDTGGPNLYRFEFNVTNLKTRVQVWSGEYLVKVH